MFPGIFLFNTLFNKRTNLTILCIHEFVHITMAFLAHLVKENRAYADGSYFVHLALSSLSVHSSPVHRSEHRSFIFGINMHMCPSQCTLNVKLR